MFSSQKIHCGIIKILKFNFLTQNFSLSLWWAGDGETFSFSLSQSFFSLLCNLPQRKVVSTQLQTGYNGSQRVTTGPNGLERVPSQRVPTGSNGGGRGKVNDTFIISPQLYYLYHLSKKNFISIHISSLSLCNNPRKYLYKKNIVIHICLYIYI